MLAQYNIILKLIFILYILVKLVYIYTKTLLYIYTGIIRRERYYRRIITAEIGNSYI